VIEPLTSSDGLAATVPLARMTLGDLAGLKVGQTIALPEAAPGDTRLSARRKTVFICEFGRLGNHFTVRIKHPFDAGKEFMDGLVAGSG
jgi:flagellar motor switch protein FliM